MLQLKNIQEFDELIPNKWKIREFKHAENPDIIHAERENGKFSSFFLVTYTLTGYLFT